VLVFDADGEALFCGRIVGFRGGDVWVIPAYLPPTANSFRELRLVKRAHVHVQ
jgi:hypothetical protein